MSSLHELFDRYATRFHPCSQLAALGGGGGLSGSRLWRYHAEHGELLLREWPVAGPGRPHIEQIHRWLSLVADLAFVPVPISDLTGQTVQAWCGWLWEITPWMAGSPDLCRPPAHPHVQLAFSGLAQFHQRLAKEHVKVLSAGLRQRRDETARLIDGGFDSLEPAIMSDGESQPADRERAIAWLALARQFAPAVLALLERESGRLIRAQPVIRDARPEHFLFDNARLSGLVDFGAMGIDSVATDLARLIGEWFDGDRGLRGEALEAYESVRPLDPVEAQLIAVFEAGTALLIGEHWTRWHFVEKRHFDDPQAVTRGLERGLSRVERLACELAGSRLLL